MFCHVEESKNHKLNSWLSLAILHGVRCVKPTVAYSWIKSVYLKGGAYQRSRGRLSPGPDCYQRCQYWVEERNLLLNGPLASKSRLVKANYVLISAGKPGRTRIKSLHIKEEQTQDSNVLLDRLFDWTKPKSNALTVAVAFRRLEQGNLSLAEYID